MKFNLNAARQFHSFFGVELERKTPTCNSSFYRTCTQLGVQFCYEPAAPYGATYLLINQINEIYNILFVFCKKYYNFRISLNI